MDDDTNSGELSARRSRHSSSRGKELNIIVQVLDDAVYAVAGTQVHGWKTTTRRRNERAVKKLGKLEKMLGADVSRSPSSKSEVNGEFSNQVLVRAARGHGADDGPEIGTNLAASAALSSEAIQESLVSVLAALDALDAKNGGGSASKRRITQVRRQDGTLECTLDDIVRRSGAPTLTPQQRAAAASVLEQRLLPQANIVAEAFEFDVSHACPSGAPVTCADSGGNLMFVGHNDGSITVWKAARLLYDLVGHQGPILCLAAQDSYLVSGGGDDTVRVWEMACGACINVLDLMPDEKSRATSNADDAAAVLAAKQAANARRHALPAELQVRLQAPLIEQLAVNVKAAAWALEHFDRAMLLDKLNYASRNLSDGALDFGPCRTPLPGFITQPAPAGASARVRWYLRAVEWSIENRDGPLCREKISAAIEASEMLTSEGFDVQSQRGQFDPNRAYSNRIVAVALDTLSETSGQTYENDIARFMKPTVHVALRSERGSRVATLSFDAANGRQLGAWKVASTHGLTAFGVEAERGGDRHTKGAARVLHEVDVKPFIAANPQEMRRASEHSLDRPQVSPRGERDGRGRAGEMARSGSRHGTLERPPRVLSPGRSGRGDGDGGGDRDRERALSPSRRSGHTRALSPGRGRGGRESPQPHHHHHHQQQQQAAAAASAAAVDDTPGAARVCVSLSEELNVRVWRAYTGRLLQVMHYSTLPVGTVPLYRGPGAYLYTRTVSALVVAYADSTLREWRVYVPSRYEPAAPRANEWSSSKTGHVKPARQPTIGATVAEQLKMQLDEANRRIVELTADLARVRERESQARAASRHDRKKIINLTEEVRRLHAALIGDADAANAAAAASIEAAVEAADDASSQAPSSRASSPPPLNFSDKSVADKHGAPPARKPPVRPAAVLSPRQPAAAAAAPPPSTPPPKPVAPPLSMARDVAERQNSDRQLKAADADVTEESDDVEQSSGSSYESDTEEEHDIDDDDDDDDDAPPAPQQPPPSSQAAKLAALPAASPAAKLLPSQQLAADKTDASQQPSTEKLGKSGRKKIKKKDKATMKAAKAAAKSSLQQQQNLAQSQPPPPRSAPPPQPAPPDAPTLGKSAPATPTAAKAAPVAVAPQRLSFGDDDRDQVSSGGDDDDSGSSTVPDDEPLSESPSRVVEQSAPAARVKSLLVYLRLMTPEPLHVGRATRFSLFIKNITTDALVQLHEIQSQLSVVATVSLPGGMRMRQQLQVATDKGQIVATLVPRMAGKAQLLALLNDEPLTLDGGVMLVDIAPVQASV